MTAGESQSPSHYSQGSSRKNPGFPFRPSLKTGSFFTSFFLYLINKSMSRHGPRPNSWKVKGDIPHQQHIAWHRQRAQAIFRGEHWELTFEDFQAAWADKWEQRGRAADQYCMTRLDPSASWHPRNIEVITRLDHLRQHRRRQVTGFYSSLKGEHNGEENL